MDFGQQYRGEFPVSEHWAYMNHAAVGPLSRRAAAAVPGLIEDACRHGGAHDSDWDQLYAGLRSSTARLIGASANEIAIIKNTAEGLLVVANGLDWRPGDSTAAVEGEFPANFYPGSTWRSAG